ncbi:hypothetical protein PZ892_10520 [Sphingobacterium sp. WM]|uniref:hypothetical protein n=1 Tax=Sphingobacterium sp. WM TaxID=3031802 RepID=UPI00240D84A5|nr:hypothetical protein [Sphingobacterium sp. WM]WFB62114.1 hypothetical protein PZ892_10520 [Sphingobacterium sp. WM]
MKNKYLIFFLLSFIVGCKKPIERTEFDKILLKKIIESGNELPSGYNFKVYVKCENGFSETTIDELIFQYKNLNIKEEYGTFLQAALNHEYVF